MTYRYIGTKVITAWPQDRITQDTADSPKEIEQGYAVKYEDGYISWSPLLTFAGAYRLAEGDVQSLTFGDALHFLKLGYRVTRTGWNGANQFVYLVPPASYPAQTTAARSQFGDSVPYNAYLALKTVNNTVSTWAPSTSDCLAEDWRVL